MSPLPCGSAGAIPGRAARNLLRDVMGARAARPASSRGNDGAAAGVLVALQRGMAAYEELRCAELLEVR